jgi:hypothetical protein
VNFVFFVNFVAVFVKGFGKNNAKPVKARQKPVKIRQNSAAFGRAGQARKAQPFVL